MTVKTKKGTSEHNESTDTLKTTDMQPDRKNLIADEILSENCSDGVSASENEKEKYTVINPKEENHILDNPIRGKPKRENPVQENPPQINTKLNKY